MTLPELMKKGGLQRIATATVATLATHKGKSTPTIATVARVAVATPAETLLSPSGESRIRTWLDYIEEDDPEAIEEVIEKCCLDMEARRYFLGRAEEVPDDWPPDKRGGSPSGVSYHERVTCGDCIHFKRIDHPPHLGHCAKGEPEAPAGLWGSDRRYCESYALSQSRQE